MHIVVCCLPVWSRIHMTVTAAGGCVWFTSGQGFKDPRVINLSPLFWQQCLENAKTRPWQNTASCMLFTCECICGHVVLCPGETGKKPTNLGQFIEPPTYKSDTGHLQISYTGGDACSDTQQTHTTVTFICRPGEYLISVDLIPPSTSHTFMGQRRLLCWCCSAIDMQYLLIIQGQQFMVIHPHGGFQVHRFTHI